MTATLMPHWLTKQAELTPDKTMFELPDGTAYTFLQVKNESMQLAKKLATIGVGEKSKVAILSPNSLHMVYTIFALSYLQAIAILLNVRLSKQELIYQITQSDADIVITTSDLKYEKQLDMTSIKTFSEIRKLTELEVTFANEMNLTNPFTMMFTSGTTGLPKAVVHTYENHLWSALGSMLNLGLHDNDKWLLTLPIFHIGGFAILMRSVIYGMTIFFMEKYERHVLYDSVIGKGITIASLVSVMLQQLIEDLGEKMLPSSCRALLLGGGPVSDTVLQQVNEKQLPVFLSYGMTETSSQIVTLSKEHMYEKIGSSGKPLFPAQLKIASESDSEIGEIYVKGPMVMNGYYKNEEANKKSFTDGWFKTGDIGYVDKDGFLFVVDRRTDLIISGGENIYPSEIENVLLMMKGIHEVAVVGKRDDKWGEVPVAFVVMSNEPLQSESIIQFCQKYLAPFKVPRDIFFVTQLPRNATNKVLRYELKQMLKK